MDQRPCEFPDVDAMLSPPALKRIKLLSLMPNFIIGLCASIWYWYGMVWYYFKDPFLPIAGCVLTPTFISENHVYFIKICRYYLKYLPFIIKTYTLRKLYYQLFFFVRFRLNFTLSNLKWQSFIILLLFLFFRHCYFRRQCLLHKVYVVELCH